MPDYKYVLYETLDSGTIVAHHAQPSRIPERAEPGTPGRAQRGVLAGRGGRRGAGGDPRRHGPDVLVGPRPGLQGRPGGVDAGTGQHPTRTINGATRKGAERLMLQEWHYYFENTRRWRNLRKITIGQAHGDVYAAGLMLLWACDLIVCAEGTRFADVVGHPARHVRRRVLRPPVGVRAAEGQGAPAHRGLDRRRGGLPARHGEQGVPGRRADATGRSSSPSGSPSCRP